MVPIGEKFEMAIGRIEFDTTSGLQDRMRNVDSDMGRKTMRTIRTFCPDCGPNVAVDEDGCCSCGCIATGDAVERLNTHIDYMKNSDDAYIASIIMNKKRVHEVLGDINTEEFAAFCKDAIMIKMLEKEMFCETWRTNEDNQD